ncbi:MAG TPA: DUF2188 domain-containing protein [Gemmatimonadaceae bacterium]
MGKNVHVTHDKEHKNWKVKDEGASTPSSTHRTQGAAIDAGRDRAKDHKSELVIHDRDNKIRDKDSYGHDPHPPIDKKH